MSLFHWLFLGICVYAAIQDCLYFKIPNSCVVGIILLFALKVILIQDFSDFYFPFFIFLSVLVGGFVLYSFKLFGAGDAKLLAATSLWASESNIVAFLVFTALAGGLLSLLYLWFGKTFESARVFAVNKFSRGQETIESVNVPPRAIPYGVAIFTGSVMVMIQSGMR